MGILALLLMIGGALSGLGGLAEPELDDAVAGGGAEPEGDEAELKVGSDGDDMLKGGDAADWLLGMNGNDILVGGDGGDVIIGGEGMDQIKAGSGADFVESANVVDEAALRASAQPGGAIDEVIFDYDLPRGSDEGDRVNLAAGDDTVVAGSDDTVTGGAGEDEFALGDWIEGGRPVEITDFDEAEDVISFVYDKTGETPELEVMRDPQTGVTTIRADGQSVAVLRGTSPEFSLKNVVVGRYAA